MPEMQLSHALIACFVACTAYAFALNTKWGMAATLYATWATVVVGVGIVLAFIATQPAHTAETDLYFFMAGGAPMVIRSVGLSVSHVVDWALFLLRERGGGR